MLYRGSIPIPPESELLAFESVARNGSFSRAARELRIPQALLRSRIAALEETLSTPLFECSGSELSLTERGLRFRDAVVAGLRVIELGMTEASSRAESEDAV